MFLFVSVERIFAREPLRVVVRILHRTIEERKMTLSELLKKAEELERIASDLRAMAYCEGTLTNESTGRPPEGGRLPGDKDSAGQGNKA